MKLIKNNKVKFLAIFALVVAIIGSILIAVWSATYRKSEWINGVWVRDYNKEPFAGEPGNCLIASLAFFGVQFILGILILVSQKDLIKPKGIAIASGILSILFLIPFASIVLLIICVSMPHKYRVNEANEINKLKEELKTLREKNL